MSRGPHNSASASRSAALTIVARRVVRVHHEQCARTRGERPLDAGKIDATSGRDTRADREQPTPRRVASGARTTDSSAAESRTSSPGSHSSLKSSEYASLVLAVSAMRRGSTREPASGEVVSHGVPRVEDASGSGRYVSPRGIGQRRQQVGRVVEAGARRIRLASGRCSRRRRAACARASATGCSPRGSQECATRTSRQDLDGLDHVAFEDAVDDVHAIENLREDRVRVVVAWVVDQVDEDLRVARVATARGDAERAAARAATGRPRRA